MNQIRYLSTNISISIISSRIIVLLSVFFVRLGFWQESNRGGEIDLIVEEEKGRVIEIIGNLIFMGIRMVYFKILLLCKIKNPAF